MPTRFVVDNSVVMAWCFEDEVDAYADAILTRLTRDEALVPGIWPLEVANVLVVAERKRRIAARESDRFVDLLHALPIAVVEEIPARLLTETLALARAHGLSAYDAAYLDLAIRERLPLATRDADLRKAARLADVPLATAHS